MTRRKKALSTLLALAACATVWQVMTRNTVPEFLGWWFASVVLYRATVLLLLLAVVGLQLLILARPVSHDTRPVDALAPSRGPALSLRRVPLVRSVSPARSLVGHVTLGELLESFEQLTSLQAEQRVEPLKGRWFKYQGRLSAVEREGLRPLAGGEPPVVATFRLKEAWEFPSIQFRFSPETMPALAALRRGDLIAMEGTLLSVNKSRATLDQAELSFVEAEV